jgi:DNA-directed RNA polymerase subunit RPC12/RpoP
MRCFNCKNRLSASNIFDLKFGENSISCHHCGVNVVYSERVLLFKVVLAFLGIIYAICIRLYNLNLLIECLLACGIIFISIAGFLLVFRRE